ncbi:hypothetical protein CK203_066017 [Vitis vinifera]|uniref:Uncharacterized protein n=1 Tax=Vitis vinifera TaxID=29760 RepID=A0A438G328_VITVI|nr:hypothetical protein CK203_066017 [Vitis vinifera]
MKQGDREVTEYYTEMLEEDGERKSFEFLAAERELDIRSRVFNRQSLPSIREVFSEVRHEESRRKVMLEYLTSRPEASALVTRGPHARSSPRQSKRTYCEHYGTLSPIAGKGSIRIYESITLNPVLHDLSSGKMIGSAKEREGLYYFDEANVRGQCPPTVCNSASSPRGKWTFVMAELLAQRRMSAKRQFWPFKESLFGEAAHKCLFLGLINSICSMVFQVAIST